MSFFLLPPLDDDDDDEDENEPTKSKLIKFRFACLPVPRSPSSRYRRLNMLDEHRYHGQLYLTRRKIEC